MDVPCRWRGERTDPSRSGEDLKLQAGYLVGFQPCVLMIITYNNNNPEIRWTFHHSNPSITGIPIFSRRHMSWKHLDVTSSGKKEPRSSGAGEFFISKQILSFFPSNTVDTPPSKATKQVGFVQGQRDHVLMGSQVDGPEAWQRVSKEAGVMRYW